MPYSCSAANATTGLTGGSCWQPTEEVSVGSRFGSALALGDTNAGGADNEIVAGAPFGDFQPGFGGDSGDDEGVAFQFPIDGDFPKFGAAGDLFGSAVAMGDFRGAGAHQVLVGIPESDAAGPSSAGEIRLYDATTASTFAPSFEQGTGTVLESAEAFDRLGQVLGVGDFDADGLDDAVFGVPGENLDDLGANKLDAGVVHVHYGHTDGLEAGAAQIFHWDAGFTGWSALGNDRFGSAVASGDFNGDGVDDLAIGAATATSGASGNGLVQVLYGQAPIFVDGFESGDTSLWMP